MADTLLFRGGSSADITASTVQNRELVIDTDTDQIVSGASKKKTVMEDSNGNAGIGTTNPQAKLEVDAGSITGQQQIIRARASGAFGTCVLRTDIDADTNDIYLTGTGNSSTNINFESGSNTGQLRLSTDGNVSSTGNVLIGGTLPSAPNTTLASNGDITTAGKITIERATPAFFLKKDNATANEGTYSFSVIGDSSLVIQGRNDINTAGSSYFKFSRVANSNSIDAFVGLRSTTPWFEVNNTDKQVRIGGTLPSAPNITLASDGTITAGTYNTLTVGRGSGDISSNTVVGGDAFALNTTGNNSTAIGRFALAANTTGNFNTAVGATTLENNTEGSSNTAHGYQSLRVNTIGSSNTSSGFRSLFSNTEGNNNAAHGRDSLYLNISGAKNTAIGFEAGYYIEGSRNTILGAYKGTAADSTLNDTVIISAGATERARCDSNGDWDFGSIILKSPDGTSFRLSVANDGTLSASSI